MIEGVINFEKTVEEYEEWVMGELDGQERRDFVIVHILRRLRETEKYTPKVRLVPFGEMCSTK